MVGPPISQEIIRKSTAFDGTDVSPMPKAEAEAELTLVVIAARNGTVEEALAYGRNTLNIVRRSQPSLLMVGAELDQALQQRYPNKATCEPSITLSLLLPARLGSSANPTLTCPW
jgi:hypothetical protein